MIPVVTRPVTARSCPVKQRRSGYATGPGSSGDGEPAYGMRKEPLSGSPVDWYPRSAARTDACRQRKTGIGTPDIAVSRPEVPLLSREKSFHPYPADLHERAWRDSGVPAGEIQSRERRNKPLNRHPEDLRHALSELIGKEDDLLWNIEVLSHDLRPLKAREQGSDIFRTLFRNMIMDAREGIIAYDTELRCILWNTFMEQLTGIPAG